VCVDPQQREAPGAALLYRRGIFIVAIPRFGRGYPRPRPAGYRPCHLVELGIEHLRSRHVPSLKQCTLSHMTTYIVADSEDR
jgi:hypothetical protein